MERKQLGVTDSRGNGRGKGLVVAIFITGDTHGLLGINRLSEEGFPEQYDMTKNDYIIIAGDFGLIFLNDEREFLLRKWLNKRPFTTLFIDGNHENFEALDKYPIETWHGGKVSFIEDSIIHLKRGQVFNLDNKKIFTFGGARSIDKHSRTPGYDWWDQEMPNSRQEQEGLDNLALHGNSVDYVITHDCSGKTLDDLVKYGLLMNKQETRLSHFLDEVEEAVDYKHWYFAHHHKDRVIDNKHTVIFENIVKLK